MTTLIEQAKAVKLNHTLKKQITKEEFDLALAYLRGEVTNKQVGVTIGEPQGTSLFVYRCLMWGFREGWLVEAPKDKN
ncbi:MAG: hypothetical protein AAB456_00320 [Patescibacteria group bacterium]